MIYRTSIVVASALAGVVLTSAPHAYANGCPSGKVVADNGQKPGATAHKGVTESLLGQIDLSNEKVAVAGHHFRMRRLVVQPGGEVAWHSHAERPALIYVISGTITEYASTCSVPIEHTAGDLSIEQGGLSHWWKNNSKKKTVLISTDIAVDPVEQGM